MKNFTLLVIVVFSMISCSKEEQFSELKLKNGDEVELFVDHRYGAINDQPLVLPGKKPSPLSLYSFTDRIPGYTYRVKAKMVVEKKPPEDGSAYYLNFEKVLSREKYKGSEPFEISLIHSQVPSGPIIRLNKKDEQYFYIEGIIALTPANAEVRQQLETIWQNASYIRENWQASDARIKWKAIKAKVIHDPGNFGKAYLVQQIEFTD